MHLLHDILISFCWFVFVSAYRNQLFTIAKLEEGRTREYKCAVYEGVRTQKDQDEDTNSSRRTSPLPSRTTSGLSGTTAIENPYEVYQNYLHKFLYGKNIEMDGRCIIIC
nr:uncharacterized protein LOC117981981 [Maniola hyperantus]